MIMTCSRNSSRAGSTVRSGASPVRRGGSVVVMMMIVVGLLLLLFLFASRVVGCRRHPLLPSPFRLPVVGL